MKNLCLQLYSDICVGLQYKQLHDITEQCLIEVLNAYAYAHTCYAHYCLAL